MPYQILKSENYSGLHGINTRISTYLTPETEFLNLQNLGFNKVGALETMVGFQRFNSTGITSQVTSIPSATPIMGIVEFNDANQYLFTATNQGWFDSTGGTFLSVYQSVFDGFSGIGSSYNPYSFVTGNYLFGANSVDFVTNYAGSKMGGYTFASVGGNVNKFFAYSMATYGTTFSYQYSLPVPSISNVADSSTPLTTDVTWWVSYIRNDGFIGPAAKVTLNPVGAFGPFFITGNTYSAYSSDNAGITTSSFGISGVLIWLQTPDTITTYGANPVLYGGNTMTILPPGDLTGITFKLTDAARSGGGSYSVSPFQPEEYYGTFIYEPQTSVSGISTLIKEYTIPGPAVTPTANPSTIEVYNSAMFFGGFQNFRDTVWFSQLGEYEKKDLDGFFDVNAGDGDIVSCLKAYLGNLVMFKTNSINVLSGSDKNSYIQASVTNQYGCLSPNAACIWNQNLWFLDKKGVAEYNGANTKIVSDKVESYFKRMNVSVARSQSTMIHMKDYSEIWCAIPIDNANFANIVIFYDYVADAWGTRSISDCTSMLATISSSQRTRYGYASAYGNIFFLGATYRSSLTTYLDDLHPYTAVVKSRFIAPLGNSVEKMFRRLYIDASIPPGVTYPVTINFYADQGITTPVLSTTMGLNAFQNRIDFGIPAASLSMEMIYSGGSYLKFNGFTIDYRYQRAVTSEPG